MDKRDVETYVTRYSTRLSEFGYDPRALGWGKGGRQEVRFSVLSGPILKQKTGSVLDVGCGFADLYGYLRAQGWEGRYTGVDLVPGLVEVARQRYPNLDVRVVDFSTADLLESYDFVVACGAFNAKLVHTDNEQYIEEMLRRMWRHTRQVLACDFMTTEVDYQASGAWHTDPSWALTRVLSLTRRVVLRSDYMPYEYAVFAMRDTEASLQNVFKHQSLL